MTKEPNVLFIITHDVGRSYGCYGNKEVHTPHIDKLAEESVVFEEHFCHWPLCGPARANLFSGCRPLTTQRFDNHPFFPNFRKKMGPDFEPLPGHFRRNGYETFAAGFVYHDVDDPGSWSLGHWRPTHDEMRKEHAEGTRDGLPSRLRGQYQSPEAVQLIRDRWAALVAAGYTADDLEDEYIARQARGPAVDAGDVEDEAYHGGQVAAKTVEMLQSLPKDKPFFVAAGFIDPHLPFWAPKKYWDLYDRNKLTLPAFRKPPAGSPEWAMGDSEPAQYYTTFGYDKPWIASDEQSLELLHGRYAVLSYFDNLVGKMLDALEKAGHADDTIVVLTSDHGFHDGEHGYWGKHNCWDKSFQVPLMIRLPKSCRQTGRVGGLTEHVDVYPTLCDVAGLPQPVGFLEGASMASLLESPQPEFKKAVFANRKHMWHDRIKAYDMAHTVRTKRYRLTRYVDAEGVPIYLELFDYQKDPEERNNHVDEPEYAEALKELNKLLDDGWQSVQPA
jgi:arylsulfatase A-like enzyme